MKKNKGFSLTETIVAITLIIIISIGVMSCMLFVKSVQKNTIIKTNLFNISQNCMAIYSSSTNLIGVIDTLDYIYPNIAIYTVNDTADYIEVHTPTSLINDTADCYIYINDEGTISEKVSKNYVMIKLRKTENVIKFNCTIYKNNESFYAIPQELTKVEEV